MEKAETSSKKVENFVNKRFYWILIAVNPIFFGFLANIIEVQNVAEAQLATGVYAICWFVLLVWRGMLVDGMKAFKEYRKEAAKPARTIDQIIDDEWKNHNKET